MHTPNSNVLGKWTIVKKNDANTLLITVIRPGLHLPAVFYEQLDDISVMVP